MKTFVALLTILVAMIIVVPAFAGQEPYKAAVCEDRATALQYFYESPKVFQFAHPDTCYYKGDTYTFVPVPGQVIPPDCVPDTVGYKCPTKCEERFKSKTAAIHPEWCCDPLPGDPGPSCEPLDCDSSTDVCTSLTPKGNYGWYEWVIVLPKKPEGEINLEIECAVTKPEIPLVRYCAAETGESVDNNCSRIPGSYLNKAALPKIRVKAYPGAQNVPFQPFHLTAYKNPSNYAISRVQSGPKIGNLKDSASLQVLDGSDKSAIALKSCLEKTILMKWPVTGEINSAGDTEWSLEPGDLIRVVMEIPKKNTVDVYCGEYSVTLGGIGEPWTFTTASEMPAVESGDCGLEDILDLLHQKYMF